jgi:hypothetical protein
MASARAGHTATLLPSGQVLVAGGHRSSCANPPCKNFSIATAELYDPAAGTWMAMPSMHLARDSHTATLLGSGKVLVTGGTSSSSSPGLASAELFDPVSRTWGLLGPMSRLRYRHAAALLPSGQVLVIGGYSGTHVLSSAESYVPEQGDWMCR